jgi:hypothetical protein
MKSFLKKCWENKAIRNVGNVLVSVVLSVVLVNNGVSVDDAKQITGAVGAVIGVFNERSNDNQFFADINRSRYFVDRLKHYQSV